MKTALLIIRRWLAPLCLFLLSACGTGAEPTLQDKSMMKVTLATPIENFITATNNHDTDAFLAQFAADADITDWGHHYQGKTGVLAWNTTDNIGANASMEVISVKSVQREGLAGQAVTVNVKSRKFTGRGLIQFYLQGDLIQRIIIEP